MKTDAVPLHASRDRPGADPEPGAGSLDAGDFNEWLETMTAALAGRGASNVPCGDCNACCRASYFIALTPEDTPARARLPAALIFPAPGASAGHDLIPYDDQGACPMLTAGQCAIYADRPFTCRQYDCRVFAATGLAEPGEAKREVMDRARRWRFSYASPAARARQATLAAGAAFLCREAPHLEGLPQNATQLALLAVQLLPVFEALGDRLDDADVAASRAAVTSAIAAIYDP